MKLTEQQLKALAYALDLTRVEADRSEESRHLPGEDADGFYWELHALFSDAYVEHMREKAKAEAEQC